jgi:nitroimidazol reductase NimA-like FMN-containing flavoprotein (pyridoxamine 5'-phosphate oxidase superfamily)
MSAYLPTPRTTLKRLPQRGAYDRALVHAILDEGLVCHVGFAAEGQPFVIPTVYGRQGDTLFLHGSAASRMLKTLAGGVDVCVTVTLVDGLVLARSSFHHSINYRSVMILGRAVEVTLPEGKRRALECVVDHVVPGRTREARGPNEKELAATKVLSLPLAEVSAKVRTGPPLDDEEDYALPVWAGEIPLRLVVGPPVAEPRLDPKRAASAVVTGYKRPGWRE